MDQFNQQHNGFESSSEQGQPINFERIKYVLKKSVIYVATVFVVAFIISFLVNRYRVDVYEASADLKLAFEDNTAGLSLSIGDDDNSISKISGELEILRSNTFIKRVQEAAELDLSIWYYGRIKTIERYNNSEINIKIKKKDPLLYDRKFDILYQKGNSFQLNYQDLSGSPVSQEFQFDQDITIEGLKFSISKTKNLLEGSQLYFILNSPESIRNYISLNLAVNIKLLSAKIISVSFKDPNKRKAIDMVNKVIDVYLTYTKIQKNLENTKKIKFMESELDNIQVQLNQFYNFSEDFTIRNQSINIQGDVQRSIQQITSLDSQMYVLNKKIIDTENLKESLKNEEESLRIISSIQNTPENVRKAIDIYLQLIERKGRMQNIANQKTQASKLILQRLEIARSNLEELLDQFNIAQNEDLQELQDRKSSLVSNFKRLPSKGSEFGRKQKAFDLQQDMYLELYKEKLKFQIAIAGTRPNFEVLSSASSSTQVISLTKNMIYGIGVIIALFISIIIIGIIYVLHDKITSENDLKSQLSMPVIGAISSIKTKSYEQVIDFQKVKTNGELMETFRLIRSNISYLRPNKENLSCLITSNISGEGKTFISVNTARIYALSGKKTIVVDLDMRRPSIHRHFDQSSTFEKGIESVLIGRATLDEVVEKSHIENLSYLPVGSIPPNPAELILKPSFTELLKSLKEQYEVVIIDTPPVGILTDAINAMKLIDVNLFVFRQNYSYLKSIPAIKELIETFKFENTAVVFNSVKKPKHAKYGKYYYTGGNYFDEGKEFKGSFLQRLFKK